MGPKVAHNLEDHEIMLGKIICTQQASQTTFISMTLDRTDFQQSIVSEKYLKYVLWGKRDGTGNGDGP